MKRVLCIVSSLNTGGAETFLMKLYRTFDRDSYQMDFVVNEAGIYDEEVKKLGGKIYTTPLRTKHPINSFLALKRIVKENKYEYVLKLCDTPIGVIDVLAAKLGGARRVGVRSCNASANIGVLKRTVCFMLRPLLNALSDYKLAPSELAGRYTFGDMEFDKGKVVLLNNGIDISCYEFDEQKRAKIRSDFGIDDKYVVGHIGRFVAQKNHIFLINVFSEIIKIRKDAVLLLIGCGELEEPIREMVNTIGIQDSVIFAGTQLDVQGFLSTMDIFVLPSLYEGLPNTVVEAQANGLPCVLSDTITNDVKILESLVFLDLATTPECWAKEICALQKERTSIDVIRPIYYERHFDIDSVKESFIKNVF